MASLRDLLVHAAGRAADYRHDGVDRPVFPGGVDLDAVRAALGELADEPASAAVAVEELGDAVEPALVGTTGPRYFGFVIGGALDAASAAAILTPGWDQPACNAGTSPAAAMVEDVVGTWLKGLQGRPCHAQFGIETGW